MKAPFLTSIVLLLTAQASCQVRVSVSLTKPEYLEGEPVETVVRITNVGSVPVAYEKGAGQVEVEVEGQKKRPAPPNLWGCFAGEGGGGGIGMGHPPQLLPGSSTEFNYLLRNYQLHSGHYLVRISGRAGVLWKFYGSDPPGVTSQFHEGDPVLGADFNQTLMLILRPGTESELRAAYKPYVADAISGPPDRTYMARDAISDMAPAFLEKTILDFAKHKDGTGFSITGLSRIDTAEARSDLVGLFNSTYNLRTRASIVHALAGMNSKDQLGFFASLLPGYATAPDDEGREYAILAIGRVGGEEGVQILQRFLNADRAKAPQHIRSVIAIALASGKSPAAIPILIDLYRDPSGEVQNSVCGSLLSLTHMNWCDGSGNVSGLQSQWRDWWAKNASTAKIYGTRDCPALNKTPSLPLK